MCGNRLHVALILFLLSCGGCAHDSLSGSGAAEDRQRTSDGDEGQRIPDDVQQVARDYKSLKLLTPEPVFMNPELAMYCVGASKEMVDAARENHGPHANCTVQIYMNDIAAAAFQGHNKYPLGAVVVKEKEMLGYRAKDNSGWEGTGNGVGGMIKRSLGFDPEHGDWEYFYFENVNDIQSGRMDSCIQCHSKAKNSDFVYGTWKPENDKAVNADNSEY